MLSDTVGAKIRHIRRARGMSRDQLSAKCAEYGYPLSVGVLLNIESGRVTGGRKRREVTVDELAVIARALGTSPMRLVFAVGEDDTTEVAGAEVDTFAAARWWRGDDPFPGLVLSSEVLHEWLYPRDALSLYNWHWKTVGLCEAAREHEDDERIGELAEELKKCRKQLRAGRFLLPPLPAFLTFVDAAASASVTLGPLDAHAYGRVVPGATTDAPASGSPDE